MGDDFRTTYFDPLVTRYASKEMIRNFSDAKRYATWRRLWVALAEAQKELGLPITDEQIEEMKKHIDDIDFEAVERVEMKVKHDVVAHIKVFGAQCPKAQPIIHLGATSAFVTDNADLILMRDGLLILKKRLVEVIRRLAAFADQYKELPTLGYTHFQPAQPTTVGKRACLWLYDLVCDLEELELRLKGLRMRGVKGTIGTQDSFLKLFQNRHDKVVTLDRLVSQKMGFEDSYEICGQTYPRKVDFLIVNVLCGIAQSAYKFSNDLRLLQGLGEMEEPFAESQVGSSAMPYKRNPVKSERMTSLARFVMTSSQNAALTAATQWLERSLDDSAVRRLYIPQMFLATDAILRLYVALSTGLVVHTEVVERRLKDHLPFIAVETVMMEMVKRGGDRQELHEKIRQHSMKAAAEMKAGKRNDLLERLAADLSFATASDLLKSAMVPSNFTGRASQQVEAFLNGVVRKVLERNKFIGEEKPEDLL